MKLRFVLLIFSIFYISSCGTSKKSETASTIREDFNKKNRGQISLLTRIRQLPGITLVNGAPVVNKTTNSISSFGNGEPLYVLNGQIIGNSFERINELIDNYNVKKIKVLTDSNASFYGTQGAKGVVEITTYQ